MDAYTQEQLEEALSKAYNYGSRAGWKAEGLDTSYIGTVERQERLCDLYVDTRGNYWYKVRVRTERGIVSEEEAIFGKKIKRYRRG